MPHPVLSASRGAPPHPSRAARPVAWATVADPGPDVAILLTGCDALAATIRGFRTLLPRATVLVYDDGLTPAAVAEVGTAGGILRGATSGSRRAQVRRMLADVDADIYILAHGVGPEDVCLAPLIVAEIDGNARDLVDVSRLAAGAGGDAGDRLLSRAVDFLFGQGGDMLSSDFKACSRRFARSYRVAAAGPERASALDLSLHALRLRLPVGRLTALSAGRAPSSGPPPARTIAGWLGLLHLVWRLLVEERPRRVLGLLGLAIVAAGIATALPPLTIYRWRGTLPFGPATLMSLMLMAAGAGLGAAGAALDALAAARQEVARVGVENIPRRGERAPPQSSVSQSSVS